MRVFVRCLCSIMINSLMFSPWFLNCFLCFHRIKTITMMWGFFPFICSENQNINFPCTTKCVGFFLLPWRVFTIGIKQLCTYRNSKAPTMVYNPISQLALRGVWWNGQTLEKGLKLNKLKWELDFWINSLPLRHRIIRNRLIGSQTRAFYFLHGVNPITVTISIC